MKTCLLFLLLSLFALTAHAQRHHGRRPYIGIGAKALFNDGASFVIDGRATVGNYFSLRPDLILNRKYTSPQIAFTVDGRLTSGWWLYAGAGGAYNNDSDKRLQPYATAGTDLNLLLRLTLRLSGQLLFREGDTDAGGLVSLNFRF